MTDLPEANTSNAPFKEDTEQTRKKCCDPYDGNPDAAGYSYLGAGRGMLVMSNIFMSQSLLFLATTAAGCELGKTCTTSVHGFLPASLITNIASISALASCLFMPICGAFVDFTPYRKPIGIATAAVMIAVQAIQIYTVESTWFPMAIMQCVAIVFYQLQIVCIYAYLPDMARDVGESKMNGFSKNFQQVQFGSQAIFLVVIAAIRISLKTDFVVTGQISQGLNTFSSLIFFSVGWLKYMTPREALRVLPDDHGCLLTEGFRENWKTAKSIQTNYKRGLRWFFYAVCFSEASAAAITSVSVVYLSDTLTLDSTETAIFYTITLIGTLPGSQFGHLVTTKTNPNTSYKLSMGYIFVALMVGALVLEPLPTWCAYIWALFVGWGLGWYYPVENLFFSMTLPKGREAEFAGFFVLCTQILAMIPPAIFTVMLTYEVPQKYGIIATSSFFVVAVLLLMCTASWDEIVEEAKTPIAVEPATDEKEGVEELEA